MAYYLLNIIMLYFKEKKNTIHHQNIDNSFECKEQEKIDFFSFFRNIKNIQELWSKAIIIEDKFFFSS